MSSCSIVDCEKPADTRGWCGMHYRRWVRHGDPLKLVKVRGVCDVDGCERPHRARGFCMPHYRRVVATGDPGDATIKRYRKDATRYVNPTDGYVRVKIPDHPRASRGWVREHIVVMEKKLGRGLWPGEEVHHRNGSKSDNRPENLEIWVVSQPKGQRPADLLAWAREILERYEGDPAA